MADSSDPKELLPEISVALIGNPNTGKSTIFSSLCGIQTRIGNYPGVTVEKKVGRYQDTEGTVSIIDLPGTYSLSARTLDEQVSVDVLLGRQKDAPPLDAVVVIADASNLERNLYLFSQVIDLGLPTILVLNMWDRVAAEQITIDLDQLRKRLDVTIVTASAHRRVGVTQIKTAIRQTIKAGQTNTPRLLPDCFYQERSQLSQWLQEQGAEALPNFLLDRLLLDTGGTLGQEFQRKGITGIEAELSQARQRLASQGCRVPAVETIVRYGWIRQQLTGVVQRPLEERLTWSDRLDSFFTHRVWGLLAFVAVMFLIFQSLYSWASPAMDGIESMQGWVSEAVATRMEPSTLRSLIIDGLIAGVGSVLVFLPQILLLFLFIGILEDCGYMARAAFVMDKLMTKLGLSGKSFVPLMSSFACAVPGIMATRVIENRSDRMVTILIAPLMSCSARLPVYLLMIGAFVPATSIAGGWIGIQGLVLLAMQSLGAVIAVPIAWILKKTFFSSEIPPFVMELPPYKWPSPRVVLHRVWERGQAFVTRAGTLIFCTSILVWAAGYFPSDRAPLNQTLAQLEKLPAEPAEGESEETSITQRREALRADLSRLGGIAIEESFLGMAGKQIEPIVKPLGWDWKIGVGVIASFPAREVIIATLGTIYSLGGEVDETDSGLKDAISEAKWADDGRPVYNLPVALSIMVFFALCAQCAATLMTIRRETNSWSWPLFTFGYMTSLAYVGAFVTYRISLWIFGGG